MPAPYGECLNDNRIKTRLANEMRRLKFNYSRQNCMTFCEQLQTIEQLGCYDLRYPQIFNATPCSTRKQFDRLQKLVFSNYSMCAKECPFECSIVSYSAKTSYANYPSYEFYVSEMVNKPEFYTKLFGTSDVSYEMFSDVISAVFIGFDQLRYMYLSDKPSFEIADIFANVGGTLGLFLGFSILSFVELFDLIYKLVESTFRIYRQRAHLKEEHSLENRIERF